MKGGVTLSTVLVVEVVTPNFRLIEVNLEKEGFKVVRASDLDQVQEKRSSPELVQQLSLVIVDIILRGVESGFEICRLLRASPETSHLPIFVLTSRHDIAARKLACELGINAFATKPYHPRDLLAVVKKLSYRSIPDQPQGAD